MQKLLTASCKNLLTMWWQIHLTTHIANHETCSANALDLTGQRFGRLTVLGLDPVPYVSPSGKNRARKEAEAEYYAPIIEAYNAEKE